jgi:hypothetical protein
MYLAGGDLRGVDKKDPGAYAGMGFLWGSPNQYLFDPLKLLEL